MTPNVSHCIRFAVLGAVDLRLPDGRTVPTILVQPKRLAVLARLAALPAGAFLRRDLLLSLLWPELDEAHARNALNKTVHHLRQALGDGTLLSRGDEELGLNPLQFCTDAQAFETAVGARDWTQVAALYRGDYLAGLHIPGAPDFEEWVEQERSRLRRLATHAAADAADRLAGGGTMGAAIDAARRAVAWSGDEEPAVRRLMTLLDRHGDRAGALRTYDEFAGRLRQELGVSPGAETRALRNEIVARGETSGQRSPPPAVPTRDAASVGQTMVALASPPVGTPRRRRRIVMGLAAVTLAVTALALLASRDRQPGGASASPHTFAVLPFATTGSDSSLVRLGRDLMVLISARVNGIADIGVIDPVAVLAQSDARTAEGKDVRLVSALESLGATQILEGSLIRVGDRVRIDGRLFAAGEGRPVARIEITGSEAEMVALADSVVLQLVGQLWQSSAPVSPLPPALSTRSVPALRAFLDGERLLAEDRTSEATAKYAAAIAADSTFWMASWRYLYFEDDFGRVRYTALAERLREHRDELPEPERTLVEARFTDSLAVRHRLLAGAVAQNPSSWEAWYNYADHLYHFAPFQAGTRAAAQQALERTVALNPGFADAWDHLFNVSLQQGDRVAARRSLQALERLHYDSATSASIGFDVLRIYRWYFAMMGAGGQAPPDLSDSIASAWLEYHGPIPLAAFDVGPLRYGFAEAQIDFGERVLSRSPSQVIADGQMRGMSVAWAARGAWDSALAVADRYAASTSLAEADFFRYQLAVIGAWLGGAPPAEAQRRRAPAAQTVADLTPDAVGELAWLDGVLAATRGDAGGIEEARRRVRGLADPMGGWLDRSLAGLALDLRGDRAASVAALAQVEGERIDVQPYDQSNFRQPYLTAVNRMVLSRGLAAMGDTAEALRQLRWAEAYLQVSALERARSAITGLVDLERARLEAATGQSELAGRHFRQFLRRYDMPVPAHQHLVNEAKAALGQLEAIECPEADSACGGSK